MNCISNKFFDDKKKNFLSKVNLIQEINFLQTKEKLSNDIIIDFFNIKYNSCEYILNKFISNPQFDQNFIESQSKKK